MIARVYTASKMKEAKRWMELQRDCPYVHCHARWLKRAMMGEDEEDVDRMAPVFWRENQEDIENSDALLLYVEPGDHLRGALVEVGIAIANGVPVIIVGEHPDHGTWKHHKGVEWAEDIDDAIGMIREKFTE